jgi:pimeloyl-ACP methyl ester carboxylesterase
VEIDRPDIRRAHEAAIDDRREQAGEIDVPTLILHGDDDRIVPIGASAMRSFKQVKGATLKVYKGAPHGMCTTHKDQVNTDLLESSNPDTSSAQTRLRGRLDEEEYSCS